MKFIINRTSHRDDSTSPCEGAAPECIPDYDYRTCDMEHIRAQPWGARWFAVGADHHDIEGGCVRYLGMRRVWTLEVSTLDELLKLAQREGQIIISPANQPRDAVTFEIEIYDDYRE